MTSVRSIRISKPQLNKLYHNKARFKIALFFIQEPMNYKQFIKLVLVIID